jgi:transposase
MHWVYDSDEGSDYHDAVNFEKFQRWIENYMLPSFHAKYPGKVPILVLDNAPYHVFGLFNPMSASLTKRDLENKLRSMGVNIIKVNRQDAEGNRIEKEFSMPFGKGGKNHPTNDELRTVTMKLMKERNDNELKTWVERVEGLEVIYTPPYMPSFQTIELVWTDTKNYVAKQYQTGRSFETFLSDNQIRSWGVDCNKLVQHCRRSMNSWISQDKVISGNLEKLIVPENYQRELESFSSLVS